MNDLDAFQLVGDWREPGEYRAALALPYHADGRLLLQMRDDKPGIAVPGMWGCFGGQIEPDEDPLTAVAREFEEETGLVYAKHLFRPAYCALTEGPRFGLLRLFLVPLRDPITAIRAYEGSGFAFCSKSQSLKLDLVGHLRPVVEAFWRDFSDGTGPFERSD